MTRKAVGWGTALVVLVLAFGVLAFRPRTEAQQAPSQAAGHKYTVDAGKGVGDDLHLRGSLDLNQVGRPVLRAKKVAR